MALTIDQIELAISDAESRLSKIKSIYPGSWGMISEEGRATEEYKEAKKDFDKYFSMLRKYNQLNKPKFKGYNIKTGA